MESEKLEFIDISFAHMVTDEGLCAFESKNFPLKHLCLSGLTGVTGKGLYFPIFAGRKTLLIYEGGLMNQEELKVSDFGKALGVCFRLQSVSLGGCTHISDEFFGFLCSGEQEQDGFRTKPGFSDLLTFKLNFLVKISDASLQKLVQTCPRLEHLEMPGCELFTEYGIEGIFKHYRNIKFADINHIPAVTPAFYE